MNVRRSFLHVFIASILVIATTHYVQAAVIIPDASYQIAVSGLGNSLSPPDGIGTLAPGQTCDTGSGGACETSTATVDGFDASITGSDQCRVGFPQPCASNSIQATASVVTTIWYAVINPANPLDTTPVPLLITASITTGVSGTGSASTTASGIVTWGSGADFIQACTLQGASFCPNPGSAFGSDASTATNMNAAFSVPVNSAQSVTERLTGDAPSSTDGTGFTASIDPFLVINPDFLSTHPGFFIEFSANFPTAPTSVPEPASLAIFSAGLAALGVMRLKRKAR